MNLSSISEWISKNPVIIIISSVGSILTIIAYFTGFFRSAFFIRTMKWCFKYTFYPIFICKNVMKQAKRIDPLDKDISLLREQLNQLVIKFNINPYDSSYYTDKNSLYLNGDMLFSTRPEDYVGPYCQTCYYQNEGHPLTPVRADTNHDTVYIYCGIHEKNFTIPVKEYDRIYDHVSSIRKQNK